MAIIVVKELEEGSDGKLVVKNDELQKRYPILRGGKGQVFCTLRAVLAEHGKRVILQPNQTRWFPYLSNQKKGYSSSPEFHST